METLCRGENREFRKVRRHKEWSSTEPDCRISEKMNGDVESAQSPDTQEKEMVKASNELKKLMKIRDGRRKYVDEVRNNLEEVLNAGNKFQKQQKKVVLWEEFTHLEKLDGKILDLMTEFEDMDIDKEMGSASKLRADMHLGMIQIDEALANMTPAASTKSTSETGEPAKKSVSVKLPKLVLQNFSGEPHTRQRFWDVFERNIHKNKALEPIDKFDYLIGLLHRPAATAIQGFEVTGANYEEAIGKLKRRFGRNNLFVQSHMEEFMKIQRVFSEKEIS